MGYRVINSETNEPVLDGFVFATAEAAGKEARFLNSRGDKSAAISGAHTG